MANSQSSRPKLAMDSPIVLAMMNGAPPGFDRSPGDRGRGSSRSLLVTPGEQHVVSHDGPGQPASFVRVPPFIQQTTVSVQLSHCPSAKHALRQHCCPSSEQ